MIFALNLKNHQYGFLKSISRYYQYKRIMSKSKVVNRTYTKAYTNATVSCLNGSITHSTSKHASLVRYIHGYLRSYSTMGSKVYLASYSSTKNQRINQIKHNILFGE